MRRGGHIAIGVVLLLTLTTPLNAAAPKAGAKCTKKNSTATSSGKLFTCIQSGKKLVWNKGVAIPKPTPTPSPSPSKPTAIGDPIGAVGSTPTPKPTPTPHEPKDDRPPPGSGGRARGCRSTQRIPQRTGKVVSSSCFKKSAY